MASLAPHAHIRSCTLCRQRKVKCDRQQPCLNCARANSDCVYPAGPGRAPKRPRQAVNVKVLDRLTQLETTIRHLQQQSRAENGSPNPDATPDPKPGDVQAQSEDTGSASPSEASLDQKLGRLMIGETKSYYVSNALWADLGHEIEELRDILHQPGSDDEDSPYADTPSSQPSAPLLSNAALFRFHSLAHSLRPFHPQLQQSVALFTTFQENIVPVVRAFHLPTLAQMYWDAVAALDSVDKNSEALLFAIYYSAATSLDHAACARLLGISRDAACSTFRFAVEQALARANLLNTQSIVLLQAVVIFLSALRHEDDTRAVWSLTALVFHTAQAMGLHRDGAAFGLRPLETETRRRLWYHICFLDNRSTEYHGHEPIVREGAFDTRPPLNINDEDLTAEMAEPPAEREGATEMTFALMRCEAMRVGWRLNNVRLDSQGVGSSSADPMSLSIKERIKLVEDLRTRLQEKYLKYCTDTDAYHQVISTVAHLIIARVWLMVHFPLARHRQGGDVPMSDADMRDKLFTTSVGVVERSARIFTDPIFAKWNWHSRTYVRDLRSLSLNYFCGSSKMRFIQWYAVALALSEICSRPPSEMCDRAWRAINTIWEEWNIRGSLKEKGELWRPIKRLMAKAKYVRDVQQGLVPGGEQAPAPTAALKAFDVPSTSGVTGLSEATATSNFETFLMDDIEDTAWMDSLNPFMPMCSGNVPGQGQEDLFAMGLSPHDRSRSGTSDWTSESYNIDGSYWT
ncbi:Zn(II)2Cys6 transcription factor [Xylariaceae sp. FL0016]|nr:Zn(II)2Cys6 transcription factor [Xylariaceae sp. FL0016]